VPFRFNQLLAEAGLNPSSVRLLRHQTQLAGARSLLDVWRTDRGTFEEYQSLQLAAKRGSFQRPYWAAFFGTWDGRSIFAGIYAVGEPQTLPDAVEVPISGGVEAAGTVDRYACELTDKLRGYSERLFIDWGGGASGKRSWSQRAETQDKIITELYLDAVEAPFPGLMQIQAPLSVIAESPASWIRHLSAARGIYLLACPRTGELYVGSATAVGGFWSRWLEYRRTGHGGNVALMQREPSDYQVSILEVAGSAQTTDDIFAAEQLWKAKLQSRARGLNRN
jgi:hypothetical protein